MIVGKPDKFDSCNFCLTPVVSGMLKRSESRLWNFKRHSNNGLLAVICEPCIHELVEKTINASPKQ